MKSSDPAHQRVSLRKQKASEEAAARDGYKHGLTGEPYDNPHDIVSGEWIAWDQGFAAGRGGQLTLGDRQLLDEDE